MNIRSWRPSGRYGWPAAYVGGALLAAGGVWGVAGLPDDGAAVSEESAAVRETRPRPSDAEVAKEATQARLAVDAAIAPEPLDSRSNLDSDDLESATRDRRSREATETAPLHVGEYRNPDDHQPGTTAQASHHVGELLDPEADVPTP